MGTIVGSLANTAELLAVLVSSGAEGAYQKAKPQARVYLKSVLMTVLVGLVLVPTLALAKMVTGVALFAYGAALIAIVFTLVLGLLWSPLGVITGMLAENTMNPLVGGERFVRFIAAALFVELMVCGYLVRVPTHQNLEAVPLLIIAAAAAGLGTFVWGGFFSGKFYTGIATAMMLLTSLSFFMPTVFAAITQNLQTMDAEFAEFLGYRDPNIIYSTSGKSMMDPREQIKIPLVANTWSEEIYLPMGDYAFGTPGKWLEHKGRDGVKGRNVIHRVDSHYSETDLTFVGDDGVYKTNFPMVFPINSNGEYFRFRTDVNGTAFVVPIRRK